MATTDARAGPSEDVPPSVGASPAATSGSGGRPFLSVIVTAHDRREFLKGAVESVLAQTIPRSDYEVVVVKILHDPEVDAWLEQQRPTVQVVTDASLGRLGQKLVRGIELARGEVICFLEDDDRYLPEKLATVAERFRDDPSLVYFRNRNRCIDAAGRPLLGPYDRASDHDIVIPSSTRDDRLTVTFMRHYGAEGNSSIAVRRSLLLPHLKVLAGLTPSTDWVFFVSALASSGSLIVGVTPLSEYRLHDSMCQTSSRPSRERLGEQIARSGAAVLELARGSRAERAARFLRGRATISWYLIDPKARRPSWEALRGAAWSAWLREEPTFAIRIGWCGLRLLAPKAVSNAFWEYGRRDSLRQNWRTEEGSRSGPVSPGAPSR